MEQIKSFIEKVNNDKGLQEKMKALAEKKAASSEVAALAKENGFTFTAADFDAFAQDAAKRAVASGQMSEEQLAAVAGGSYATGWALMSIMTVGLGCAARAIVSNQLGDINCANIPQEKW
jgi:predicted ribosomally synthesized peptide with nif11-like leader